MGRPARILSPEDTVILKLFFFSILQRKRLTAPNFADLDALEQRLLAFIEEWNESAHPFAWTAKSFDKVLAKIDAELAMAA